MEPNSEHAIVRHEKRGNRMDMRAIAVVFFAAALPGLSMAEEAVKVGGAYALLNKPDSPQAAVILIPGGHGRMGIRPDGSFADLAGNQLVRTRKAYLGHGVASLTIDLGVNVASAVEYMRKIAPKVVIVGTSRGTLRAPNGLSARPDGLVLTAGFLPDVRARVGSASALPATLVVHHRQDGCHHTSPGNVEPFQAWGGGKVKVVWMSGGTDSGDPCQARGYHGFNGLDGQVVSAVASFAKSVK
jgi:hypothetical protein